jgi:glycosyltransferase involved in cell wall biosynthesis/peptidoglycan/xylan/chitin deacetylase (PgdA/CDA1 family)
MRIAHLVDSLDYGGAEKVVVGLALQQARRHAAHVICLRDLGPQPLGVSTLARAGVQVATLGKPSGPHAGTLVKLIKYLRRHRIEVVHTHNHLVHHYGAVAGRLAGCPAIINTLHGSATLTMNAWAKALFWTSSRLGHKVVSVCRQVHDVFRAAYRLPCGHYAVVNNGVDMPAATNVGHCSRSTPMTFGNVARFDPVKDHDTLLRAFAVVRKQRPYARLRLLGDGELLPDMKQLAEQLSIADNVEFEGFSPDASSFLKKIDVYVIASRNEGLPLTLLEAMAAGIPVVSTAVGGVPEIIGDAGCGWLCRPSDINDLATTMVKALDRPDLNLVGARGRQAVERHYSVERMACDYESLYESVLNRDSGLLERNRRQNGVAPDIRLTKKLALSMMSAAGMFRLGEMLGARNLRVLTYHRVVPRSCCADGKRPGNTLFTDEFDAQMAFVAKRFNVLNGEELRAVIEGSGEILPNSLVITFDDGYENNFSHALPILQRYGLHAVFFVTANLIGREAAEFWFDRLDRLRAAVPTPDIIQQLRRHDPSVSSRQYQNISIYFKNLSHTRQSELLDQLEQHFRYYAIPAANAAVHGLMSWDQVRAMAAAGMTIGSHSANHQILSAVSATESEQEIVSSRKRIEQEIGRPCWCFAYPNGERRDFRPSDEIALGRAGYACAFTQIPGSISSRSRRFALPRTPVPDTGDIRIFRYQVSGVGRTLRRVLTNT